MEHYKDSSEGEKDTLRGVFETREQLDFYEKWWHVNVYQPTWDQLLEKVSIKLEVNVIVTI